MKRNRVWITTTALLLMLAAAQWVGADDGSVWQVARTVLKVVAGLVVVVVIGILLMPITAVLWRAIKGEPERPGRSRRD
jgi:hypothetical protein